MKRSTLSQLKTLLPIAAGGFVLALGFQNCARGGATGDGSVPTGVASSIGDTSLDPLKSSVPVDANGTEIGPAFELSRMVHRDEDSLKISNYTAGAFSLRFSAVASDIADDGSADVVMKNLSFSASAACHLNLTGTGQMARAHGSPLKIGALKLAVGASSAGADSGCQQAFNDDDQKLLADGAYAGLLAQVSAYAVMDGELHLFLENGDEVTFRPSASVGSSAGQGQGLSFAQISDALASGMRAVQIVKPTPCADVAAQGTICVQSLVQQNLLGQLVVSTAGGVLRVRGNCANYAANLAGRSPNANENLSPDEVPVAISGFSASASSANCASSLALEDEAVLQLLRNLRSIRGSTSDLFLTTAAGSTIELRVDTNTAQ